MGGSVIVEIALGLTLFQPTTPDGTWWQQPFEHRFQTTDIAARAGVGWRVNEQWMLKASYVRLGTVDAAARFVTDADYDPVHHRCVEHCQRLASLAAHDRVQGAELTVTRTFPFQVIQPFVKIGGAYLFHHVTVPARSPENKDWSTQFSGSFPALVIGGGLCYHWICSEVSWYRGIDVVAKFPIATEAIVTLVNLQVPLW